MSMHRNTDERQQNNNDGRPIALPIMDWGHKPLAEAFDAFKDRMLTYFQRQKIVEESRQALKIKLAIGDVGIEWLRNSGLTTDDKERPDKLWERLELKIDPSAGLGYRIQRIQFETMCQQPNESIDEFVSRLKRKAKGCEFGDVETNERLVERVLATTPLKQLRIHILEKPKGYKIDKVVERGRQIEARNSLKAK